MGRDRFVTLVRERYAGFGPNLAHQKLKEERGVWLSVETLRLWMIKAGIWLPRYRRRRRSYQPRERRESLGQLVQIDGCGIGCFEPV